MGESCEECKHWVGGHCWRYPPSILTDGKDDKFWQRPETKAQETCGEYNKKK